MAKPATPRSTKSTRIPVTISVTGENHERLIRAYINDVTRLSEGDRNRTLPGWIEGIIFDWVKAVEDEISEIEGAQKKTRKKTK